MSRRKLRGKNIPVNEAGLTPKQAIFEENVLSVGPVGAAKIAYPKASWRSQQVIANYNMKNKAIISSLSERANRMGLTLETGLAAVKKGLEHEEPRAYLKAAELCFKIHGELQESAPTNIALFTPELFEQLIAARKSRNDTPQLPS